MVQDRDLVTVEQ